MSSLVKRSCPLLVRFFFSFFLLDSRLSTDSMRTMMVWMEEVTSPGRVAMLVHQAGLVSRARGVQPGRAPSLLATSLATSIKIQSPLCRRPENDLLIPMMPLECQIKVCHSKKCPLVWSRHFWPFFEAPSTTQHSTPSCCCCS